MANYYVDGAWGGAESGTEAEPYNTIQEAITAAEANAGDHNIYIKPGTYPETANNRLVIGAGFNGKYFTFTLWPGTSGRIVLNGSNATSLVSCTNASVGSGTLQFHNFDFNPPAGLANGAININHASNNVSVALYECTYTNSTSGRGIIYAIATTSTAPSRTFIVSSCTINISAASVRWLDIDRATLTSVENCTVNSTRGIYARDSSLLVSAGTHTWSAAEEYFLGYNAVAATNRMYIEFRDMTFVSTNATKQRPIIFDTTLTRWVDRLIVKGCTYSGSGFVWIGRYARYVLIEGNTITNTLLTQRSISIGADPYSKTAFPSSMAIIRNNLIVHTGTPASTLNGIYIAWNIDGSVIEFNRVRTFGQEPIRIHGDYALVRNNEVVGRDPITVWGGIGARIINNTMYAVQQSASWIGYMHPVNEDRAPCSGYWAHNIFVTDDATRFLIFQDGDAAGPADVTVRPWAASTVYGAGTYAEPIKRNGFIYTTVGGGTSGVTEPIWPEVVGGTVADNTVTWTCVEMAPQRFGTQMDYNVLYNYGDQSKVWIIDNTQTFLGSSSVEGLKAYWPTFDPQSLDNDYNTVVQDPLFRNKTEYDLRSGRLSPAAGDTRHEESPMDRHYIGASNNTRQRK